MEAEAPEELPEEEEFDLFGDYPRTVVRNHLVVSSASSAEDNYRVGAFSIPASTEGEEAVPIIAIAVVQSSVLVAVPSTAWHRLQRQRVLPANSLSKPVAVEVAAVHVSDRSTIVSDVRIRIWIGLLKPEFEDSLVFPAPYGTSTVFPTSDG